MAGKTYVYSFENVQMTVDNLPVEGFWEGDDAVVIEPFTARATALVGVDGDATISRHAAGRAVNIRVRLKAESPANLLLASRMKQERLFPISIRNTTNGEGGSAAEAHILEEPSPNFGANATVREWVIFAVLFERNAISYEAS